MISIINSTFRGLRFLRKLDMSDNYLDALSSDVFNGLHQLVYLDIMDNPLFDIPSETLATLHSLQYLYMTYVGSTLDTVLSNCHNLKRLRVLQMIPLRVNITNATFLPLAGLPIQECVFVVHPLCTDCGYLDKCVFDPLTSVRKLFTDVIGLPALGSLRSPLQDLALSSLLKSLPYVLNKTTFQVLSNVNESLTNLSLYFPLRRIENDAFMWTPNLIVMHICKSQLQTLDKQAFRGLSVLQWLDLSDNQLTAVPSGALGVIGSLQFLDLGSNRISAIADVSFSEALSLRYLNLEKNNIQDYFIHIGWLGLLRNLKHLVFGSLGSISGFIEINQPVPLLSLQIFELRSVWVTFTTNFCSTFPNVATVLISDAVIVNDSPFVLALHECLFLTELDLSGSVSTNLLDLKNTNISIPSLKVLTLARNELKSIEQILFIEAQNLVSLNLSDNQIKNIDTAISHAFTNLIYLSIDGNGLVSITGLEHLTFLKGLNAARNQITEVPLWLISTTNGPVLMTLDLSKNPFSCTCEIEKFKEWIVSDTNTLLQPGQYNCATPESLKGICISEVELDCRSFTAFYIGVSMPFAILFCMLITLLIRYRWHIKYKLFLLYRNYRPFPENNEDFEMLQLQYHAYIAYNENSTDDAWVFSDLQPNMEEDPEPVHLCIKSRDFIPGHSLLESISENIQKSRKTILVLSPNFVESEWCYHEMEMAKMRLLDENLDVIVLVLLKEIPNKKITLSLRQLLCKKEYLKWPKDRAGQMLFWQRLREELKTPVQTDRRFCM